MTQPPTPDSGDQRHFYVCTRCGNCCKWAGIVRVDDDNIRAMSRHLGISEERFIAEYTQVSPDRTGLVLTDRDDGACVFLDGDSHCRVYPVRPEQCKTFPNGWNFPGFEHECPAVKMAYTMKRLLGEDDQDGGGETDG